MSQDLPEPTAIQLLDAAQRLLDHSVEQRSVGVLGGRWRRVVATETARRGQWQARVAAPPALAMARSGAMTGEDDGDIGAAEGAVWATAGEGGAADTADGAVRATSSEGGRAADAPGWAVVGTSGENVSVEVARSRDPGLGSGLERSGHVRWRGLLLSPEPPSASPAGVAGSLEAHLQPPDCSRAISSRARAAQ